MENLSGLLESELLSLAHISHVALTLDSSDGSSTAGAHEATEKYRAERPRSIPHSMPNERNGTDEFTLSRRRAVGSLGHQRLAGYGP
jgi:hypothetical protein